MSNSNTVMVRIYDNSKSDGIDKLVIVDAHAVPDIGDKLFLYAGAYSKEYVVIDKRYSYSAYHGNNNMERVRDASIKLFVRESGDT